MTQPVAIWYIEGESRNKERKRKKPHAYQLGVAGERTNHREQPTTQLYDRDDNDGTIYLKCLNEHEHRRLNAQEHIEVHASLESIRDNFNNLATHIIPEVVDVSF